MVLHLFYKVEPNPEGCNHFGCWCGRHPKRGSYRYRARCFFAGRSLLASRYSFLLEERGRGSCRRTPFPVGRSTIGRKALFSVERSPMVARHSLCLVREGLVLVARHYSTGAERVSWLQGTLFRWKESNGHSTLFPACGKREGFCLLTLVLVGKRGSGSVCQTLFPVEV